MASMDFKSMSKDELLKLQEQLNEHLRKLMIDEIDQKERELNELRVSVGIRARPLSTTVAKRAEGLKKTKAASAAKSE